MVTPVAKSVARIARSGSGRDKFDASLLAFEAFVKYISCVAFAGLNQVDRDDCYALEHELSRSIALGSWIRSLRKIAHKIKRASKEIHVAEWLWKGINWLDCKRKETNEPDVWFFEIADLSKKIHAHLRRDGDRSDHDFATILGILEFFAYVRNKTKGHGAKSDLFYRGCDEYVAKAICKLVQECPWAHLRLLAKIPGTFRDHLVLSGMTPTERVELEAAEKIDPDRSIFVDSGSDSHAYLPRLIEYLSDNDTCLFANDDFQKSNYQMEFLNYFDGTIRHFRLSAYASDPVPQNRVRDICEFPKEDALAQRGSPLTQVHRPKTIGQARTHLAVAPWRQHALTGANRDLPPSRGGVYCLISHADTAGLEAHRIIGYVGKTGDLCVRFKDYLDERDADDGRPSVKIFLKQFPKVVFWYTVIDASDDRARLEDWMIKAIDPPANQRMRLSGSRNESG